MTDKKSAEPRASKVVVADDQPEIVRFLKRFFERKGYRVRTALSGEEALAHIAAELPDLIVCDIMMPRMDGFEVHRELKAGEGTRDIPFILLAGKAADGSLLRGWAGRFFVERDRDEFFNVYYLTKPLSETDLEGALGEIYVRFPGVKGS